MASVPQAWWRRATTSGRRARLRRLATTPRTEAAPAPRRPAAVPWGLVGMVAAVVAIEGWIGARPLDFSEPVSLSWRLGAEAADREAPGGAVLCLGDSLVKHGLFPRALEATAGRRALNLAGARAPAPATYFLLRRALAAGARPAAVIVDFKPAVLACDTRYNLRYWQEVVGVREFLDLVCGPGGRSIAVPLALGRLLPSVRGRLEIRAGVRAALRGETSLTSRQNRTCLRNWRVNRGANAAARNPAFTGVVSPEEVRKLHARRFFCSHINSACLRRFFALAARRDVPAYWLLPPLAPGLQECRERLGTEERYLGLVRSIMAEFPNVTVLDGRHSGYGAEVFVDPTHLDKRGGWTLSRDVGAIVRRDLAGERRASRWIALPEFRHDPAAETLEDVEESKARLCLSP